MDQGVLSPIRYTRYASVLALTLLFPDFASTEPWNDRLSQIKRDVDTVTDYDITKTFGDESLLDGLLVISRDGAGYGVTGNYLQLKEHFSFASPATEVWNGETKLPRLIFMFSDVLEFANSHFAFRGSVDWDQWPVSSGVTAIFYGNTIVLDRDFQAPPFQGCYPWLVCIDSTPGHSMPQPGEFRTFGQAGEVVFGFRDVQFSKKYISTFALSLESLRGRLLKSQLPTERKDAIWAVATALVSRENPARKMMNYSVSQEEFPELVKVALEWEAKSRPDIVIQNHIRRFVSLHPDIGPNSYHDYIGSVPITILNINKFLQIAPLEPFGKWQIEYVNWIADQLKTARVTGDSALRDQALVLADKVKIVPLPPGALAAEYADALEAVSKEREIILRYTLASEVGTDEASSVEAVTVITNQLTRQRYLVPNRLRMSKLANENGTRRFGWIIQGGKIGIGRLRLFMEGDLVAYSYPATVKTDDSTGEQILDLEDIILEDDEISSSDCNVTGTRARCWVDLNDGASSLIFLSRLASAQGISGRLSWKVRTQETLKGEASVRVSLVSRISQSCVSVAEGRTKNNCAVAVRLDSPEKREGSAEIAPGASEDLIADQNSFVRPVVSDSSHLAALFRVLPEAQLFQKITVKHGLTRVRNGYGSLSYVDGSVTIQSEDIGVAAQSYPFSLGAAPGTYRDFEVARGPTTKTKFSGVAHYADGSLKFSGESDGPLVTISDASLEPDK
ncbi:hypothetical protein [Sinorhizobium meliloti]|uniref:hypothetical protein n=1 Tax=Rhizobium meliloti TaxID=382 RepID=UPI0012959DE4|nr:hypothetical protein [Sinorhizobium meliloti]MQU92892.1 hypothetical protein [Sinorhizobium meliloti]